MMTVKVLRPRAAARLLIALLMAVPVPLRSQRGGAAPAPAPVPRAAAPIDLTGYWVSVVTEDWRYRMLTPPKGDYASVPLNEAGRRIADVWDPAKDEASGNQCKSYGVGNVMRVPGRVHITWQDDNTLKIDTDAGTQMRLLHFGDSTQTPAGDAGWQGYSVARWELAGPQRGGGGGGGARDAVTIGGVVQGAPAPDIAGGRGRGREGAAGRWGSLKVVTTHMKAGYLRKNGVPYSENAVVTEYFDRHLEPNGDEWFTVTTIVDDPKYLDQPFITSTHFKKERDASKWRPTACAAG
jgi:hypothetical protein